MTSKFNEKNSSTSPNDEKIKKESSFFPNAVLGKQADQLLSLDLNISKNEQYLKPNSLTNQVSAINLPKKVFNQSKNKNIQQINKKFKDNEIKAQKEEDTKQSFQKNTHKTFKNNVIESLPKKNHNTASSKLNSKKNQFNSKRLDQNKQENGISPNAKTAISKNQLSIKVAFLGGLNEIGKNITLFECKDDMFLLDCGMAFPDGDMPGVDLVIPDFTYIEQNIDKIKGIVLTHGHEDHIGAIPYLLERVNLPIYGTKLTIGLVGAKLKEAGLLRKAKLNVINCKQHIRFGCMRVELIHVNHSIPDSVAVAIHSPAGTLVHTGDFKIDCTPLQDDMIDLCHLAHLGNQGVLALFADSTNAERPGYTMTEQKVIESFQNLFYEAQDRRIIIASFASNISRLQQIIHCAHRYGRKVAYSGRSIISYMAIAAELGFLNIPEGVIIDIDLINRYPKDKVVLLTTGSQGEPMSALTRMAYSDHRKIIVGPDDFIIISANPIPGNEKTIGAVINELLKRGCHVVYESMYDVHVSGHACQEELKLIEGLIKPQYFIPVHGEQKHLRKHAGLAKAMGMPDSRIFIGEIGDLLEINKDYIKKIGSVPAGRVFVDGSGVGDVGNLVLKERKHLAEDGLIVIVAVMESSGNIISGPDILSRGFVFVKESEPLMKEARRKAFGILESHYKRGKRELGAIKMRLNEELSKLFFDKTKRNPMILPVIMEI
ncbi:MAG: ribonuclease J [Lactobacillales bacterium]|nr:ribonuclease J [Lactobacillales bacterium]